MLYINSLFFHHTGFSAFFPCFWPVFLPKITSRTPRFRNFSEKIGKTRPQWSAFPACEYRTHFFSNILLLINMYKNIPLHLSSLSCKMGFFYKISAMFVEKILFLQPHFLRNDYSAKCEQQKTSIYYSSKHITYGDF